MENSIAYNKTPTTIIIIMQHLTSCVGYKDDELQVHIGNKLRNVYEIFIDICPQSRFWPCYYFSLWDTAEFTVERNHTNVRCMTRRLVSLGI